MGPSASLTLTPSGANSAHETENGIIRWGKGKIQNYSSETTRRRTSSAAMAASMTTSRIVHLPNHTITQSDIPPFTIVKVYESHPKRYRSLTIRCSLPQENDLNSNAQALRLQGGGDGFPCDMDSKDLHTLPRMNFTNEFLLFVFPCSFWLCIHCFSLLNDFRSFIFNPVFWFRV